MSFENVQRPTPGAAARTLGLSAALLSATAASWDALGFFARMPDWWPVPGYTGIGAAVALGCIAVALHVLVTPRALRAPRVTALRLVALGVLLGAWLLRGHHEIPADAPIIVAQGVAAAVLVITGLLRT